MKRANVSMPSAAEDRAISRGIAADPDARELDDAWFANSKPAGEIMPGELLAGLIRRRGRGRAPAKIVVSLRLKPDVVATLKASGPRWQTRVGEVLGAFARSGATAADVATALELYGKLTPPVGHASAVVRPKRAKAAG